MESVELERKALPNLCKDVASLNTGIFLLDPSYRILYINEEGRRLLGGNGETLQRALQGIQGSAFGDEGSLARLFASKITGNVSLRVFTVHHAENPAFKGTVLLMEPAAGPSRNSLARYRLTPREQEVVNFLGKGFKNKDIAVALSIGIYTVKDHLKSIMSKMGAKNRLEVLLKVMPQNGEELKRAA
jgi:DNA-binding NarL/FixJ family response regulator